MACNFNADAQIADDTLCTYPEGAFVDCEGNCVVDSDMDGVCDTFEVAGCDDDEALNFDPDAAANDGSC